MSRSILVLGALAALVPAGMMSHASAPEAQPDLQLQVNQLVKKVGELQKTLTAQEARLERLEADMAGVATWFGSLPDASAALSAGLDVVFKKGFTYAGANLEARSELLKTLRGLAANLTRARPGFGEGR